MLVLPMLLLLLLLLSQWKLQLYDVKCSHLLSNMNYLDETRVGIWGWGYGGYVTAMVLGAQQQVYKCGVSVSPITDWLFYSKYKFMLFLLFDFILQR